MAVCWYVFSGANGSDGRMTRGSELVRTPSGNISHQQGSKLYHYGNGLISTAFPLTALLPTETMVADGRTIQVGRLDAAPCEPSMTDWVHHWPPEVGDMSLARLKGEGSFLLRFHDLADFVISADGRQIEVWSAPSASEETCEHLLLDQVLPRILAQQGQLVLHAGAVRIRHEAIAFIGDSGIGKSTLTASLHAAGYSLLCDDGLVLTQGEVATVALPTYPSLRLWPESIASLYAQAPDVAPMAHYSSKRRIISNDLVTNANVPLPLTSLYVLGPAPDTAEISLKRLSSREACIAIIGNSFQLDITDRHRVANTFANASRIADHLPVISLTYPRDFARLPEVHNAILNR
jgi:hypothetical protein